MNINRVRTIAVLMILLIFSGAASAAAAAETPWNLRAALTREDEQGAPIANEALLRIAQPVNQTIAGEHARVTVSEALFDGKALIAAWEVENLSDEMVYLVGTVAKDSVNWARGTMIGGPTEEFVKPGQTRYEYMDCDMVNPIEEGTVRVGIRYFVLAPTEETAILNYPDPREEGYAEKQALFDVEATEKIDEGKMVIVTTSEGQPRFLDRGPSIFEEMREQYELLDGNATPADALLGTGRLKLLEELVVSFDLKVENQPASMLPDGEPVEKEYDGFTMRVTRADYTLGTVEIFLEAIFADEESANQFESENRAFIAVNEKGELIRDGGMSTWGSTGAYGARDDGAWVVEYIISHREIFALPEYVAVFPTTSDNLFDSAAYDTANGVVLTIS